MSNKTNGLLMISSNILYTSIVQISLTLKLRTVLQIRNWNTSLILTSFYNKLVQISHSKSGFLYARLYCITDELKYADRRGITRSPTLVNLLY